MTDHVSLWSLEKRKQPEIAHWVEVQKDVYHFLTQDVQSQEISLGSVCYSPTSLCSSHNHSSSQYFSDLDSSNRESLLSYDLNQENISSSSHQSSIASISQTSLANNTIIERVISSFFVDSSCDLPFAQSRHIMNISQNSYDLYSDSQSDNSLIFLRGKASDWLSPLHVAARKDHDQIVRMLLQHNVDCEDKNSNDLTSLIHVVIENHETVIRFLLSLGTRICNDDGQQCSSALHLAARHRRGNLLRILLDHCLRERTSIDCSDEMRKTPLHVAVDIEFEMSVYILLQSGANSNYRVFQLLEKKDILDQNRIDASE